MLFCYPVVLLGERDSELKMDKSMLGDLDNLPEEDKLRMSTMIDQLQIRDRFPVFFDLCFSLTFLPRFMYSLSYLVLLFLVFSENFIVLSFMLCCKFKRMQMLQLGVETVELGLYLNFKDEECLALG